MLIRKSKILSREEISKVNKLVFKVFLPISMFSNIYSADLDKTINHQVMLFVVVGIMAVYFLSYLLVFPLEKDRINRGAMIHAIYRTNYVILGVPIVTQLIGPGNIGLSCLLIAIVVPMYNVLAVVTLESFRGGKANIRKVLIGIATNPLIIGGVIGIVFLVARIHMPGILETTVTDLAKVGTPLAIVVLGASFDFGKVREGMKDLGVILLGRLIVMPAIVLFTAYGLGFRGVAFATILAIFAPPTAISSYTMAQQMGSNENLACNGVIFTTLFSSISLFLWIFIFKTIGAF
ncbi:MAG: AEC family transporter [Clostridia bacterium]|nr:AEC family transporter [Clostridia bacterium]